MQTQHQTTSQAATAAQFWRAPAARAERRVLVVNNTPLIYGGLSGQFSSIDGHPVRWSQVTALDDALTLLDRDEAFDAVLLDLMLADCKGLLGLYMLRLQHPQLRVAAFCCTADPAIVVQARALGAWGFVHQRAPMPVIEAALSALLDSATLASQAKRSKRLFASLSETALLMEEPPLKLRELQVLDRVLSGLSNEEIATNLGLLPTSVKNIFTRVLKGLETKQRAHLLSIWA